MPRKLLLTIPALVIASLASAQSSSPDVIASAGDYFTSGSLQNSYTIGEMTMVETFMDSTAGFILTQGYQQPDDFTTGISQPTASGSGLNIYPNPSDGNFSLQYQLDQSSSVTVDVYDVLGKLLYTETQSVSFGTFKKQLNLSTYESGVYFVRLTSDNGHNQTTVTQPITLTR